ncbi:MAG: restriction endonuclease subunit S [Magnetococcus sp. YQC-5]
MDAKEFLATFGHIANAPDGVKRLRELILQLSVQGKLVPQDPNDEPASVLLKRIAVEKSRLEELKKIHKTKQPLKYSDISLCVLPSLWIYTRLFDVGIISPKNIVDDDQDATFLPMTSIPSKYGDVISCETRKWENIKSGFTHFKEGDVVLAKITPCFQNGKSAVVKGIPFPVGAGTTELHVFRPISNILPEYVLIWLKSPEFIQEGIPVMTGSAGQKRITRDYFAGKPFPLPPLAEQKRIVERVDQLMALCDRLETMQQERATLRQLACSTSLDALANAQTPDDLHQAWQRIQDHTPELLTHSDAVTKLRQTILQLAVMGKLVQQDPNDEPASVLLERISAEKDRLVKERKTKKDESLPVISNDELPFELPPGWIWSRLGKMLDPYRSISYGIIKLGAEPRSGGVITLRCSDVRYRTIETSKARTVEKSLSDEYARTILKGGEVLINIRGTIGGCGVVDESHIGFNVAREVAVIPVHGSILNRFLLDVISSPHIQVRTLSNLRGISYKGLNLGILSTFLIPVAPHQEQNRIVARVDQLMLLCDQLEKQLTDERTLANNLAAAAVATLTGTRTKDRETMKRPKTELVTRLKLVASPANSDQAPLSAILASHATGLSAKDLWNRSGLDVEEFYRQLKNEMARGWIVEPDKAVMREVETA